jgi:hypothetical protein
MPGAAKGAVSGKSRHAKASAEQTDKTPGGSVDRLTVHGSVARGKETEEPGFDMYGVAMTTEQERWLRGMAAGAGVEHGGAVSLMVKTENGYKRMKHTIHGWEVRSTGVAHV